MNYRFPLCRLLWGIKNVPFHAGRQAGIGTRINLTLCCTLSISNKGGSLIQSSLSAETGYPCRPPCARLTVEGVAVVQLNSIIHFLVEKVRICSFYFDYLRVPRFVSNDTMLSYLCILLCQGLPP